MPSSLPLAMVPRRLMRGSHSSLAADLVARPATCRSVARASQNSCDQMEGAGRRAQSRARRGGVRNKTRRGGVHEKKSGAGLTFTSMPLFCSRFASMYLVVATTFALAAVPADMLR